MNVFGTYISFISRVALMKTSKPLVEMFAPEPSLVC